MSGHIYLSRYEIQYHLIIFLVGHHWSIYIGLTPKFMGCASRCVVTAEECSWGPYLTTYFQIHDIILTSIKVHVLPHWGVSPSLGGGGGGGGGGGLMVLMHVVIQTWWLSCIYPWWESWPFPLPTTICADIRFTLWNSPSPNNTIPSGVCWYVWSS